MNGPVVSDDYTCDILLVKREISTVVFQEVIYQVILNDTKRENVYVNEKKCVSDLQALIKHNFLLVFFMNY